MMLSGGVINTHAVGSKLSSPDLLCMRPMLSATFPTCLTLLLAVLALPSAAARMDQKTDLEGTKIGWLPGKGRRCLRPACKRTKGELQKNCCAQGLVCAETGQCQLGLGSVCKLKGSLEFEGSCGRSHEGPKTLCGSFDRYGEARCCVPTTVVWNGKMHANPRDHVPPSDDVSKCCSKQGDGYMHEGQNLTVCVNLW